MAALVSHARARRKQASTHRTPICAIGTLEDAIRKMTSRRVAAAQTFDQANEHFGRMFYAARWRHGAVG
jgi:hypothetical protein